MVSWACLAAALGLALEGIPEYLSLACYFLLFVAHCLFVMMADRKIHSRDGIANPS